MKSKEEQKMKNNEDIDDKCIDLESVHGELLGMKCIHPWSDEVYKDTKSPFNLSGWYRLTFEDGAKVDVGSLYAYALAQGSFWFISDDSNKVEDVVFVRALKPLAYFARMGASLIRDQEGECSLPTSTAEAENILWGDGGLGVPYEPLKYGSQKSVENMEKWVKDWQQRGLVKWDEENDGWQITH